MHLMEARVNGSGTLVEDLAFSKKKRYPLHVHGRKVGIDYINW